MTEQYLQRNINDQRGGGGGSNPQSASFFDDFTASTTASITGWNTQNSGAGSGVFPGGPAGPASPGVFIFSTGTSAGGRGRIRLGTSGSFPIQNVVNPDFIFVEWGAQIPILADGVNDYFINFGMNDGNTGGQGVVGCYFRYDFPNPNWIAVARDSGPETAVDTGITVSTSNYFRYRVEFNDTEARYFIAEYSQPFQQVASINTNLPTLGKIFGPQAVIQKQLGTTSRIMLVDYAFFGYELEDER